MLGVEQRKPPAPAAASSLGPHTNSLSAVHATGGDGAGAGDSTKAKLFEATGLSDGALNFGNVVLNDLHVLRSITLCNLTDDRLCINIRCKSSQLQGQVFFQLDNQNLGVVDEQAIQAVFNEINHIDKLFLEPHEDKQLVVSIRPRESGDKSTEAQALGDKGTMSHMRYHSFNLKATIKLTALVATCTGGIKYPLGGPMPTSPISSDVTVRLKGAACRSVMQVDRPEIVFDDCIPGGVYWKDFEVWNLSEIPLTFSLYYDGDPSHRNLFQFTSQMEEAEEVIKPSTAVHVDGWSHVRVVVQFSPTKATLGEADITIELENANDERNVVPISIHTVVTTNYHDREALLLSCGDELDFGNCFTNSEKERELTLRNITDRLMFVNLSTNKGDEATFRLKDTNVAADATSERDQSISRAEDTSSVIAEESLGGSDTDLFGDKSDGGSSVQDTATAKPKYENFTREITEINLNPGQTKTIVVRYRPMRTDETQSSASLGRRAFKLWLRCHDEMDHAMEAYTKMVSCVARVCTSLIQLRKRVVNLGDADVGDKVTRIVQIKNLSDLPSTYNIRTTSSVLSFEPKSATIAPKQTCDIKVIFAPRFRSANPNYQKDITFVNENNEEDEQVLEIKANITDQHRATFHSMFYSVQTAAGGGAIDFGNCIVNSRTVQKINVLNESKEFGAKLNIATASPEFRVYHAVLLPSIQTSPDKRATVARREELHSEDAGERLSVQSSAPALQRDESRTKKDEFLERLEKDGPAAGVHRALHRRGHAHGKHTHGAEKDLQGPTGTSSFPGREVSSRLGMASEMDLAVSSKKDKGRPLSRGPPESGLTHTESVGRNMMRAPSPELMEDTPMGRLPMSKSMTARSSMFGRAPNSLGLDDVGVDSDKHKLGNVDTKAAEQLRKREQIANALSKVDLKQAETPAALASAEDESTFVAQINQHRQNVDRLLDTGVLMPVSEVTLDPGQMKTVYVILQPSDSSNYSHKFQNKSSKLLIQLLSFEASIASGHGVDIPEDVPVREVPMRAKICRSSMKLQQRSVNFGTMHAGDERARVFVMHNQSEAPLLYNIVKSGSINSQNLRVNAQHNSVVMGLIRPYSTKEVSFTFKPNIHGPFLEELAVENAAMMKCEDRTTLVTVKAFVKNTISFDLQTEELDFGPTQPHKYSRMLRIVLTNATQRVRFFSVENLMERSNVSQWKSDMWFQLDMIERQQITVEESESTEEKLLALEQAYKKLTRKKKHEKAAKAKAEIQKLRGILDQSSDSESDSDGESAFESLSDSEDEDDSLEERLPRRDRDDRNDDRPHRNSVVFSLKPKATQVIFVKMITRPTGEPGPSDMIRLRLLYGIVQVYESSNKDALKEIEVKSTLCPTYEQFRQSCLASNLASLLTQAQTQTRDHPPTHVHSPRDLHKPVKYLLPPNSAAKKPEGTAMKLSTHHVDLGAIEVSARATASFDVANVGKVPLHFIVIRPLQDKGKKGKKQMVQQHESVQYQPNQGTVQPGGNFNINVQVTGRSAGRQEHALLVRDVKAKEDLRVVLTVKVLHPQYLECLDLDEGRTPESGKLDFGLCYINPDATFAHFVNFQKKFTQRAVPFRLKNVHSQPVEILPTSNTKQVKVFEDNKLEVKVVEHVKLDPGKTHTVYIALEPTVTADNMRENGQNHRIVGGIRVQVKAPGNENPGELTYKFEAAVAMSVIKVSNVATEVKVTPRFVKGGPASTTASRTARASAVGVGHRSGQTLIDLGGCSELGLVYEGAFELSNLTASLPAEFQVVQHPQSSCRWVKLDRTNGRLDGRDVSNETSKCIIRYSLKASAYGLLTDTVNIINKMRPSQQFSVRFRLYVDDGVLSTGLLSDNGIDHVDLAPVYVSAPPISDAPENEKGFKWKQATFETTKLDVPVRIDANVTDKDEVLLQGYSDSVVSLEWEDQHPASPLSDVELQTEPLASSIPDSGLQVVPLPDASLGPDQAGFRELELCGPEVTISKDDPAVMHIEVQRMNFAAAKALTMLKEGKIVQLRSRFVLRYQDMSSSLQGLPKPCKCPLPWHYDSCALLSSRVAKTISFTGTAGLSLGKALPRTIKLGEVGIVNSWQTVKFKFQILNQCEIPLEFETAPGGVPNVLKLSCTKGMVEGKDSVEVEGSLDPMQLKDLTQSSKDLEWEIVFANKHNRYNFLKVELNAKLTTQLVEYHGVGEDDMVRLPVVHLPSTEVVDEWFSIENLSELPLDVQVGVQLAGDMDTVLKCMLKSRESNMIVTSLTLEPHEEVEVRVLAVPMKEARSLPPSCAALQPVVADDVGLEDQDVYDVLLGKLTLDIGVRLEDNESRMHVHDVLTLRGSLTQGKNYDVSTAKLNLRPRDLEQYGVNDSKMPGQTPDEEMNVVQTSSWLSDEFVITNLSTTHTLDFQVFSLTFEPEEVRVMVTPESGTVPSGGNVVIQVRFDTNLLAEIEDFRGDDLGGKLVVQDCNVRGTEVEIDINVNMTGWDSTKTTTTAVKTVDPGRIPAARLNAMPSHHDHIDRLGGSPEVGESPQDPVKPELVLHGCTPAAYSTHRYDVDLGQQSLSSDRVVNWELTISNPSVRAAVEYRVNPVCLDSAQSWLSVSHGGGTVSAMAPSKVKLTLRLNQIGRFSAYLVIENITNPEDVKTVRVRMEVSANYSKVRQERLFNVVIDGRSTDDSVGTTSVINLGACFRGRLYRHRSFLLRNNAEIPLEFIIKNVNPDSTGTQSADEYDLDFSLANTSLKKVTVVTVGPKSTKNIYIFYRLHHRSAVGKKTHSVYISCRLVRDYQLTISLNAECCEPCLGIASRKQLHFKALEFSSATALSLTGLDLRDEEKTEDSSPTIHEDAAPLGLATGSQLRFDPPQHTISVTNLSDSPTEVTICNSTMFFVIRGIAQARSCPTEQASLQTELVTFANDVTESTYRPGSPRRHEGRDTDGSLSPQSDDGVTSSRGTSHAALEEAWGAEESHSRDPVSVVETVDVGAIGGVISGHFDAKQLRAILQPGGTLVVVVEPNFQSITTMYEQLMKEKYVEEHLTVYSRDNPKEHRWRQLRMHFIREHTSGMEEEIEFFSTKGGAQSYPFQVLEESVVHFMREFRLQVGRWAATGISMKGAANKTLDLRGGAGPGAGAATDDVLNEHQPSSSTSNAVTGVAGTADTDSVSGTTVDALSAEDLHDLLFELHYITDELVYSALKDPVGAGFIFQLANMLFTVCLKHPQFLAQSQLASTTNAVGGCESHPHDHIKHGSGPAAAGDAGASGAGSVAGVDGTAGDNDTISVGEARQRKRRQRLLSHEGATKSELGFLRKWMSQLRYFLSFFPDRDVELRPLRILLDGPMGQRLLTKTGSGSSTQPPPTPSTQHAAAVVGKPRSPEPATSSGDASGIASMPIGAAHIRGGVENVGDLE